MTLFHWNRWYRLSQIGGLYLDLSLMIIYNQLFIRKLIKISVHLPCSTCPRFDDCRGGPRSPHRVVAAEGRTSMAMAPSLEVKYGQVNEWNLLIAASLWWWKMMKGCKEFYQRDSSTHSKDPQPPKPNCIKYCPVDDWFTKPEKTLSVISVIRVGFKSA